MSRLLKKRKGSVGSALPALRKGSVGSALPALRKGSVGPALPALRFAAFATLGVLLMIDPLTSVGSGSRIGPPAAMAGDPVPISASEGLGPAASAAEAWAPDAELVYIENDEPLDGSGQALRWGYLFRSPSSNRSRGYSVEHGRVVQAADLGIRFEAPPLGNWIDSGRALIAADEKEGARFRSESGGTLSHMVLIRSATVPNKPERTSWLVVYRAPGLPGLFVLIDAISGDVDRTWRG